MLKRAWLALERGLVFNLIRLFRIRGQSERVARGFALGLIVNFFPTFGFGVLISGFFARLFGGNAIAGLVGLIGLVGAPDAEALPAQPVPDAVLEVYVRDGCPHCADAKVFLEQLAREGQLMAYKHEGFWQPMDTLREKNLLESLWESGQAPWKTW